MSMKHVILTFKRNEQKYLLDEEKYRLLFAQLNEHIEPDEYFSSTVSSVYYDTRDFSLIRRSIDAPIYKEKLRLRGYSTPSQKDVVFVELKEKFKGLVYKRRIAMPADKARDYVEGRCPAGEYSQLSREIDWFLHTHEVEPKVFLASDRQAYVATDDSRVRITFDRNIRWRDYELELALGSHGEPVLPPGQLLMELKIEETAPLWLAKILSQNKLYPTGFSKYGTCYRNNLYSGVLTNV